MKVLVVKMSSMGDIIHTLPALTDARRALSGVRFDWVAEEGFAEIPAWHPAVDRVIPVAFRRWRKRPLRSLAGNEWRAARRAIKAVDYDCVVDPQGLVKSAVVTRLARGNRCGYARHSAREGLAALAYDQRFDVSRSLHAIERTRRLFAHALAYPEPSLPAQAGLADTFPPSADTQSQRIWFLHGTARDEKTWPESHWMELARQVSAAGYGITLPAGDAKERARAQRIVDACRSLPGVHDVQVLPRATLGELARQLSAATAAVAVDTGLGHLAAALDVPAVSLYGPTNPALVGAYGARQSHLRAPASHDMSDIPAAQVWSQLQPLLGPRTPTLGTEY
jgi:heptosyltransferase-1